MVTYVLNKSEKPFQSAATVEEKKRGRFMEVYTDQLSLQFYNAWLMDGTDIGKNNQQYNSSA